MSTVAVSVCYIDQLVFIVLTVLVNGPEHVMFVNVVAVCAV